jgi:hypothetical protein
LIERQRSALTHTGAAEVFRLAEDAPVRIKGRGESDRILLNAEQYDAEQTFVPRLCLLARALAKGIVGMTDLEGLQWTKLFDQAERAQMLAELIESARTTLERKDPSIFNATWKGWEHSAQVMDDPEALAKLTAPLDLASTIPLPRP